MIIPQWLLRSYTVVYALFTLWKLDLKKQCVTHAAVWLQNESSNALDQLTNTKRFRKFCVRLTHLGTNFAPISHQILHLKKKFPKVYLIRTPSVSLPTAANPALKFVKLACQQAVYEQSNPVRTEQPCTNGAIIAVPWTDIISCNCFACSDFTK